jgi:hypothetical protein
MVTKEKVKIYKKYKGNDDEFAIYGTKRQIELVNKGLASQQYASDLEAKLKEQCDNDDTIEELRTLAEKTAY